MNIRENLRTAYDKLKGKLKIPEAQKQRDLRKAYVQIQEALRKAGNNLPEILEKMANQNGIKAAIGKARPKILQRRIIRYWNGLTPGKQIQTAALLAAAVASGGIIALTFGATALAPLIDAVTAPETGLLYIMKVDMPDGSEEVKFGMTKRSPEIRAREMNKDPGREGEYTVYASEEVDLDCMEAYENELLEAARRISGNPTVGLEQFDGIPLEDGVSLMKDAASGEDADDIVEPPTLGPEEPGTQA